MTIIQFRRGNTSEWAAANPVLTAGEPGVDLTTRVLKLGDGTTAWGTLPSIGSGLPILTTAQRNALTGVGLYRGLTIFNSNTGGVEVYYGATTGWRPPWNTNWGEMAYAEATGTQSLFGAGGAVTDITGATVTFTAIATRKYEIKATAVIALNGSVGAGVFLYLTDAANATLQGPQQTVPAPGYTPFNTMKRVMGITGSTTYKLRAYTNSGSGSMSMYQSVTNPTIISVNDVGPNGNAPAS